MYLGLLLPKTSLLKRRSVFVVLSVSFPPVVSVSLFVFVCLFVCLFVFDTLANTPGAGAGVCVCVCGGGGGGHLLFLVTGSH